MKTHLGMSENYWLQCLINSICNLYNPLPNENEKDFFVKKDTYLRYKEILQVKFSYHPTLSNVFLDENFFEKIQYQYKLNFELQRGELLSSKGEPCYKNLCSWNKKGKWMIVKLALQAQGIDPDKLFPSTLFKKILNFIKPPN